MRVIQLLSTIANGDAVSNDAVALEKVIKSMGYSTGIYAESIVSNVKRGVAQPVEKIGTLDKSDVLIYHFSTGTKLNYDIARYQCRKVMIYHNVTPPEFFKGNDERFSQICEYGLEGASFLADKMDYCLAVSTFNKNDLINMGYKCKIDVLPIVIPMDDYKRKPSRHFMKDFRDKKTNILFTGRVAPNKKHENVIAAFYYYKKLYNKNSRLILAGSYREEDRYYLRLRQYVERLGMGEDVVFTGHIKFDEILACYKLADVFLCMSEHEGFCVPIVESMMMQVPVVAYGTTAIPETMNNQGMILESSDPLVAAGCIDRVVTDNDLRKEIIRLQNERVNDFRYEAIADKFKKYLSSFIDGD